MQKALQVLKKDPILKDILHLSINVPYYDGDVNAYLYSSIISQQLSTKSADAIYNRFLAHFDGVSPSPELVIDTDPQTLRALGLSNSKTNYLKNVADYFIKSPNDPEYWNSRTDHEIISELTTIKGVGEWTVQMVLMFCLARKDVFPILDLGVRQSAIQIYNVSGEKKEVNAHLLKIAEQWKPYRSIASLYLWSWRKKMGKNGKNNRGV